MPFTPLHMGPGTLLKALLQGSFSLMIFGWTQIVMDIQPLLVMLTGSGHLHGFSHTYLGASLLAVFSALSGKYLSEWVLVWSGLALPRLSIAWWVAVLSAFIGSFSHVLLDSIMHADVQPWFPFSEANALYQWLSLSALHQLCLYSGVVGAVLYFAVRYRLRPR